MIRLYVQSNPTGIEVTAEMFDAPGGPSTCLDGRASADMNGWFALGMTMEDCFRAGVMRGIESANRALCSATRTEAIKT
jgi:hypothetical protein